MRVNSSLEVMKPMLVALSKYVYKYKLNGMIARVFLFVAILTLAACASRGPYQIDLMPAPDVYDDGVIDPLPAAAPDEIIPYPGVLYATDREPATENDKAHFYQNKRGHELRLGVANVEFKDARITWEEARRISLLKNRTEKYPLKVNKADEIGILDRTFTAFTPPDLVPSKPREPAERFAEYINKKLKRSQRKDIFIYVHGYKVVFENPVLIAAELWHFLGYEGVFIAYAWPATPKRLAYFADLETTVVSARNLRIFLEYLAEEAEARRIHIIAYSAGTRVVTRALEQLALRNHKKNASELRKQLRIGHVVLLASDVDRQVFGSYVSDGILKVTGHMNIYTSEKDKALGVSRWLFKRDRLGQMFAEEEITPAAAEFLRNTKNLSVINVTEAEGSSSANGHAYFRKSPWASSDVLTTVLYDLRPEERGLIRTGDSPVWSFPPDYIEKLRAVLVEVNPDLAGTPARSESRDLDKAHARE